MPAEPAPRVALHTIALLADGALATVLWPVSAPYLAAAFDAACRKPPLGPGRRTRRRVELLAVWSWLFWLAILMGLTAAAPSGRWR